MDLRDSIVFSEKSDTYPKSHNFAIEVGLSEKIKTFSAFISL